MSEELSICWSLLFETKDGMIHPIRVSYPEVVTRKEAEIAAKEYLAKHDWLKSIEDIYPT